MLHVPGWAALAVLMVYLVMFFWCTAHTARSAGGSVWLFGTAKGAERQAAIGFRAAFAFAGLGPLVWLAVPVLHKLDPLWTEGRFMASGIAGVLLAVGGALVALAAQRNMGASWRVGVSEGQTGALVQGGLFRVSRNPTFLGQLLLLVGVALAIPALPTLAGVVVFLWSAHTQIRSEEAVLLAANGASYDSFRRRVPRWVGWPQRGAQ